MKRLILKFSLLFTYSLFAQNLMGLNSDQYTALVDYMENHFTTVNTYLRSHDDGDQDLERKITLIDESLARLPKYSGKTYRGVCLSDQEIAKLYLKRGNIIRDPGFMSTSKSREIAIDFIDGEEGCTPILMKIKAKSGTDIERFARANFGDDSLQVEEREVLFGRSTPLKVIRVKKKKNDWYGTINMVHLKEVK
jgi:hypothetical protein